MREFVHGSKEAASAAVDDAKMNAVVQRLQSTGKFQHIHTSKDVT